MGEGGEGAISTGDGGRRTSKWFVRGGLQSSRCRSRFTLMIARRGKVRAIAQNGRSWPSTCNQ